MTENKKSFVLWIADNCLNMKHYLKCILPSQPVLLLHMRGTATHIAPDVTQLNNIITHFPVLRESSKELHINLLLTSLSIPMSLIIFLNFSLWNIHKLKKQRGRNKASASTVLQFAWVLWGNAIQKVTKQTRQTEKWLKSSMVQLENSSFKIK